MSTSSVDNFFKIHFFAGLLLLGLWLTPRWNFVIDEPINYRNGLISEKFVLNIFAPSKYADYMAHDTVFKKTENLLTYHDNDYGVAFDLPVQFALRGLHITDSHEQYIFKHRCIFALFWLSACFFFAIVRLRFGGNSAWAYLATLLYLLHPRIFADAFYNPKDLPLLSCFVISLYFQLRYFQLPVWQRALPFAILSAITIDIRILGIILPVITALITFLQILQPFLQAFLLQRSEQNTPFRAFLAKNDFKKLFLEQIPSAFWVYSLFLLVGIYLFMPMLWTNPLFFFKIFANMSHFRWDAPILFAGESVASTAMYRTYLPTWIFISSPITYSIAGAAGIFAILECTIQNIRTRKLIFTTENELFDSLFLLHFLLPIALIIILHSIVYDGWRQVYFVYGGGTMLVLRGLFALPSLLYRLAFYINTKWNEKGFFEHLNIDFLKSKAFFSKDEIAESKPSKYAFMLLSATLLHVIYIIYLYYPYSNVYFNCTVQNAPIRYELDYWGTATVPALEYIATHDWSDSLFINNNPPIFSLDKSVMLTASHRKHFYTKPNATQNNYYITQYRFAKYDAPPDSTYTEYYTIKVADMKITTVYKKKNYETIQK
jgi:hypothetical protein